MPITSAILSPNLYFYENYKVDLIFLNCFESRNGNFAIGFSQRKKKKRQRWAILPIKKYLNSIIITTRKQNIHSWMPFNHFNILCVSLQNRSTLEFIPRHHFPNPNSLIPTTRRKERTRCIPRHTFHFIFMTLKSK